MKHICIWLIRLYRKYLSPLKSKPTCRFYPSCSSYALEAFEKRGFFAGLLLTFFRILRCNPFCPGGYDPVPAHGIPIRSYGATHGGRYDENPEDTDDSDIDGQAHAMSEPTSDAENERLPDEKNVPAAGGNTTDREETAAVSDDTPKLACVKYMPEGKASR